MAKPGGPTPVARDVVDVRELRQARARLRACLIETTARRFLGVFDGLAQDENDGTYALWTDAALFKAANELRAVLNWEPS